MLILHFQNDNKQTNKQTFPPVVKDISAYVQNGLMPISPLKYISQVIITTLTQSICILAYIIQLKRVFILTHSDYDLIKVE